MEKTKIICVVGATASGKTDLAVKLAKAVDGEIISADSMQVYKNMPIATAVATKDEQDGVPHHLVEFLDTDETFSVADFVELAKSKIAEIVSRGRVPIVAGGTGLFVDSLVKDITFSEVGSNEKIRTELAEKSNEELYEKLKELDPNAAADIHPNNRKRVIRALELCMSGTSKTEQNENSMLSDSPYDALYIGIGYKDRQKLYDRINKRVDLMLEAGLENEARQMLGKQGLTARQAIGHKELQPYINGDITLDEAAENLKRETRRYAKRQLTWFRRNENINWLYADEMSRDELVKKAVDLARKHLK
ncbi:MAG: tRNA (adenosine(37)-N6)-dimethylallyltransferase MiaA [Clostridia bacterium]|nr:tRNA (adenosine(37)-N6)-dimethylallyltransferase MiaA [Clostridia bacterium]